MAEGTTFKYEIDPEYDEIFDEKGNIVLMARKVAWNDNKSKIELRKWYVNVDKEKASAGFSFLTEEGPDNLINVLIKKGHGQTEEILESLKDREDFDEALRNVIGDKVDSIKNQKPENDYYDPKEMLGGE